MSGKVKSRTFGGNVSQAATQSVNENILKECHSLYTDPENGLVRIADSLGLSLLAPRKKITVLMIGNHSAGKSSFINWYIEEHVQRTGVAIETQGFTFVTSGRKRESLTGNATLHLYPHFEPLREIEGVVDYVTTEISTSKQKKFSLVTFVDTPGLVDGDMKYPFDVNEAIMWLGDLADLIFVFFDPIGQALCKRTLNLVEKLNEKHAERMRFYLSKADEAGHETDRQRVMMQIVQELCKRPGLNHHGFDMPTIYIPSITGKPSRCANQIEEVCKDVEKTINLTIQNTLNALERDCENIAEAVDNKLAQDNAAASSNLRSRLRSSFCCCLGMLIPIFLALCVLAANLTVKMVQDVVGKDSAKQVISNMEPFKNFMKRIPPDYEVYFLGAIGVLSMICLLASKLSSSKMPTLSRRQKRALAENREYVQNVVKKKKQTLYAEYLQQSVAEHDL